jgi:hypothetical protein
MDTCTCISRFILTLFTDGSQKMLWFEYEMSLADGAILGGSGNFRSGAYLEEVSHLGRGKFL